MDFAQASELIKSAGYNKTNTTSALVQYETTFSRGAEKIIVSWQLGGYVKKVSIGENVFESPEEFFKSFFRLVIAVFGSLAVNAFVINWLCKATLAVFPKS